MLEIDETASEYYLALIDMMDQCLHDRHFAQNVTSDLSGAKTSAAGKLQEFMVAEYFDPDLFRIFCGDFIQTESLAKKLANLDMICLDQKQEILDAASRHRIYLEEQANGYLGRLARNG